MNTPTLSTEFHVIEHDPLMRQLYFWQPILIQCDRHTTIAMAHYKQMFTHTCFCDAIHLTCMVHTHILYIHTCILIQHTVGIALESHWNVILCIRQILSWGARRPYSINIQMSSNGDWIGRGPDIFVHVSNSNLSPAMTYSTQAKVN